MQQPIQFCVEFCDLNETAVIQSIHTTFDCGLTDLGNNCVQYHPLPGFAGSDVIEVVACDNTGACDTIFVNVNVVEDCNNNAGVPVAVDDSQTVLENMPTTINVLGNDVHTGGLNITVTNVTQPAVGGTVVLENGQVIFTPDANYTGVVTFTYTITDENGLTDTATVTLNVVADGGNNNPVANDNTFDVNNQTFTTLDVLGNDFDPDGDNIIITGISDLSDPAAGTLEISENGLGLSLIHI